MVETDKIHKTFINKLKNNKFNYLDLREAFEKIMTHLKVCTYSTMDTGTTEVMK